MFAHLRRARSMLMGLAILGIAYYHAPFILHGTWTRLFHNCLYCGVDVFLLLSGIGAVHSIEKRGGRDYLRQRALRLLPGLLPMLLLWCVLMTALGFMGPWSFLGSMTLLGWWLGDPVQLNWYFSAVWMFFLLAIVCWGIPKTRNAAFSALSDNSNMAHILLEEVIFIAVLTFLCFCRGLSPIINGEEKIMDFGFMNSMLRYDGLPAKDPWLAGQPINYYYYGQYIFSYLVKMTGIRSLCLCIL